VQCKVLNVIVFVVTVWQSCGLSVYVCACLCVWVSLCWFYEWRAGIMQSPQSCGLVKANWI